MPPQMANILWIYHNIPMLLPPHTCIWYYLNVFTYGNHLIPLLNFKSSNELNSQKIVLSAHFHVSDNSIRRCHLYYMYHIIICMIHSGLLTFSPQDSVFNVDVRWNFDEISCISFGIFLFGILSFAAISTRVNIPEMILFGNTEKYSILKNMKCEKG